MSEARGIGAATVAFRRLLAEAGASDQSRVDALVALVRHTVFAVTLGDDARLRTLSNPAGESAAPLFTGQDVLQMAARGFGWAGPDGKLTWKELGAREALRQALAQGVQFVVLDLGSAYATEFARREVESVLAVQRTAGVGAYAATGTASEIIRTAVRESTRPPAGPNSFLTPVPPSPMPQMPPPPRMPVVEMDEPFRRASRVSSTPLPRPAIEVAHSLPPAGTRNSPAPPAPRVSHMPPARPASAPLPSAAPAMPSMPAPATQPAMAAVPPRSPLPVAPVATPAAAPFPTTESPTSDASGMSIPAVPPEPTPVAAAPVAEDLEPAAAAPAAPVAAPAASAATVERDPLVRRSAAATLFQVAPPKRPDSMPRVSFSSAPPPMPEAEAAPAEPVPPPPSTPSIPARSGSSGSMPAVRAPSTHNVPAPAPTASSEASTSTAQATAAPQAAPYMRRRSTATMPKPEADAASAAKKLAEKVMRAAAAPDAQRFAKSVNPMADQTLQHIAESLRRYPEVEWACELADEQGRPLVGLRLDPAFQNRAEEISALVVSAASERKMTVQVALITDTAKLREARSLGRIFYPWRKK